MIVGVDAVSIATAGDLQADLARKRPGDRISLRTVRYGDSLEVALELATLPSRAPRALQQPAVHTGPARLGFAVVQERGMVIVAEVDRFSPAARAGIRPGQRVVTLNRSEGENRLPAA